MSLYPDGCRLCLRAGAYLIEQKPCVRTVLLTTSQYLKTTNGENSIVGYTDRGLSHSGHKRFRLAMPYTLIIAHGSETHGTVSRIGFCKRSPTSMKDDVYYPPLPNVHETLDVCGGTVHNNGTAVDNIQKAITAYWNGAFTYFLRRMNHTDPRLQTFEGWQRATADDPLFILEAEITRFGTIADFVRSLT